MIEHVHTTRVRYADTDAMGYLYHGNYAALFEVGRVELLRGLGLSYRALETQHRVAMPVMSMQIRYVRPATYDDVLTVRTQIRRAPGRELVFHYELCNEGGRLVNGARVVLCFVDRDTGRRLDCPAVLSALLLPHFAQTSE